MKQIQVNKFELKLIVEHRKKFAKELFNIDGRFTKEVLSSMLYHSSKSDYVYVKPNSDVNNTDVGFYTSSIGLAYGYTEMISVSLIKTTLD